MGFGPKFGGGSKTNTTTYSTTNTMTDESLNVAEGAIAVGAGANVNIVTETADREIALGALAANQNVAIVGLDTTARVAGRALDRTADVAGLALEANRDVNIKSLDTTSRLAGLAINTVVGLGEVASRERIDPLQSANLAITSAQGASDKFAQLAGAALERSQTPDSAVTKQLLWVIGGVAALAVLILFGRGRKTA